MRGTILVPTLAPLRQVLKGEKLCCFLYNFSFYVSLQSLESVKYRPYVISYHIFIPYKAVALTHIFFVCETHPLTLSIKKERKSDDSPLYIFFSVDTSESSPDILFWYRK